MTETSNKGEAIQPLPLKDSNLDKAFYYVAIAAEKKKKDRTRAIAKAIHYLNNELKEVANENG